MSNLLIGVIGALLTTNQPTVSSNTAGQSPGVSAAASAPKDPVEQEYQRLLDKDDEAHEEVDQWIKENEKFALKGAGMPPGDMRRRIETRLAPIQQGYEEFLQLHPDHTKARVAYASFLSDFKGEEAAQVQLEKALALDTNNPAVYNNLANIYGHIGPVKKAFEFYDKAIQLSPQEPVYFHNLGTTVYLFRKDAEEYYHISEPQVFAKALELYSNSMRLDPTNFPLASDVAQTYYGIPPLRVDEALNAWTNALKLAHDDIEREGVYVHFVRINTLAGRYALAHALLNSITNPMYADLKQRVTRSLNEREKGTNAPPATLETEKKK